MFWEVEGCKQDKKWWRIGVDRDSAQSLRTPELILSTPGAFEESRRHTTLKTSEMSMLIELSWTEGVGS